MQNNFLSAYGSVDFGDLSVNFEKGWAYQTKVQTIQYDKEYWDKYVRYESNKLSPKLNLFRCNLAQKYGSSILDVGIGSGLFLKHLKCNKYGYDVNPIAINWLKQNKIYHDPYKNSNEKIDCFCFWDVLEHIDHPQEILNRIKPDAYAIISMPIFKNLEYIKLSKHYRPNEHLYYFTTQGIINFMQINQFILKEISSAETELGREEILTFVFYKDKIK